MSSFQVLQVSSPSQNIAKMRKETYFEDCLTAGAASGEEKDCFAEDGIGIKDEPLLLDWPENHTIKLEKLSTIEHEEHCDALTLPCSIPASIEENLFVANAIVEEENCVTGDIEIKDEPFLNWLEIPKGEVALAGNIIEQKCLDCGQNSSCCHEVKSDPLSNGSNAEKELNPPFKTCAKEKPFKCEQCSYTCFHKGHLIRHLRIHTVEKPFRCEQCSFSCSQKAYLVKHLRRHTDEKPYKCEKCSYSSTQKEYLVSHLRKHTGEKPFKCKQCSYSCAHKGSLVVHVRIHTGEKLLKCDQCSYRSAQKGLFISHLRTHTGEKPFKCEQCSFICAHKRSLVRHRRTHTGEKPFQCERCSYKCAQKEGLVNHLRTHTGEKPFKCENCSYSCAKRENLIRHLGKHTGFKVETL